MKKLAKQMIVAVLGWQVRRLQKKNNFKVVAVGGSVGKTSTKLAIAKTLSAKYKVQFQDGNYNDPISVPLVFFGHKMPGIYNVLAWKIIFIKNELQLRKQYPYEVVVIEVGTDLPGTIESFKKYLHADIGVLTSIAPEHMEYFADLQAVADEELSIAGYSDQMVISSDMCDKKYLNNLNGYISYGKNGDYKMTNINFEKMQSSFEVEKSGKKIFKGSHESFAEPQLHSVLAAIAVADQLGLASSEIENGLRSIKPVPGRMQLLQGINGSTIIDDTYNASPEAVLAALNTLYRLPAKHKIAILGNMNELGRYSADAHTKIGKHCDSRKLDLVVTIGVDANKYLAEAARKAGCRVESFDDPYSAGEYVKKLLDRDTIVLAKGSQNKVFAEEAVKILLSKESDDVKLVRQSKYWLKVKAKNFS